MNVLINYADECYESARKWNSWTGRYIAKFNKIFEFHPYDIDKEFKNSHKEIFAEKRGDGLWLWKPYFINKVVSECQDGDVVFYCDSGAFFTRSPKSIYKMIDDKNPLFVCDISLIESCWTKPICFERLGLNERCYKDSNQIIATYFVFKVNDFTRKFMREWLDYCCDYDLLSPAGYGKNINPPEPVGNAFVSHREDQSLFSLLCKKYKIEPHRDISQRGFNPKWYYSHLYAFREPIHTNDSYPSIIHLHKKPKLSISYFLRLLKAKFIKR